MAAQGKLDLLAVDAASAVVGPARRAWKALSLKLPWPWLIVTAPESIRKRVENRDWLPWPPFNAGEWFLLHAGRGRDQEDVNFIRDTVGNQLPTFWEIEADRQAGHLLALARVVDVTRDRAIARRWDQERWFFGPYGWLLEVRALQVPRPCRGWHKFWDVKKQLAKDLDEQGVVEVLDELDAEARRLAL